MGGDSGSSSSGSSSKGGFGGAHSMGGIAAGKAAKGFEGRGSGAAPKKNAPKQEKDEREMQKDVFADLATATTKEDFDAKLKEGKPTGYVTGAEAEALGEKAPLGIQAREVGLSVKTGPDGVSFGPTQSLSGFDVSRAIGSMFGENYDVSPEQFGAVPSEARAALAQGLTAGTVKATPKGIERSTIGQLGEIGGLAASLGTTMTGVGTLAQMGPSLATIASGAKSAVGVVGNIKDVKAMTETDIALTEAGVLAAPKQTMAKPKASLNNETSPVDSIAKPDVKLAEDTSLTSPKAPTIKTTVARKKPRKATKTVYSFFS